MSDNPFELPQKEVQPKPQPKVLHASQEKKLPGATMTIAIICLIVGLSGLMGSCTGGIFLAFQGPMMEFLNGLPGPPEQREFNRLNMAAQSSMTIPGIVLMVINFIVASLLVLGSIGVLQRKGTARNLLSLGLSGAIVYSLLKIALTVWNYFASTAAMSDALANYDGEVDKASLERLAETTSQFTMIGVGMGVLFALVLMGFYIWAKMYLGKPKVVEFFDSV